MDAESVLRLKEEAIRLKVEAIELKLESIELKLEAFDSKLGTNPGAASASFEGIDASGEDSEVEELMSQRMVNFLRNLYPRWMIKIADSEKLSIEVISIWLDVDERRIRHRLSSGPDYMKRAYNDLGGGTDLHWAVRMEDLALVTDILAKGEVDVNATDELWKATALHWAVRIGNIAIVKAMLTDHLASKKFDLRVRDKWGSTVLESAIFNGVKPNISMVEQLLKLKDSDHEYVDRRGVIEEVEEILQEGGTSIEVESRFESRRETWYGEVYGNSFGTRLHWAVNMEDAALAAHILAAGKVDVNAIDQYGCTAFIRAIQLKNLDIVKHMVTKHLETGNINVNHVHGRYMDGRFYEYTRYTALHWAVVSGEQESTGMVKELLRCEATMRLTEECHKGKTPLQIAHERGFKDIQKTLMEREVVRRYVEDLYRDRQVYVDAANAILVGAALIASVTFASWLQPPLGYTPDYANVQQHMGLRAFWVFNCLSFYFAIATVVFGARSVLPRSPYFIKRTVEKLRTNLLMTAILLACSVFFVIVAFGIAGCIVLTPIVKFQLYMIIPTIFGGLLCLISLGLLSKSMWEDSLGREHVDRRRYEWAVFTKDPYFTFSNW